MNTPRDYFDSVTQCMITFQHIEEGMKMVLARLELLTCLRLKGYTHYDSNPRCQAIQNAAMGRLLDMLKVYVDDPELISNLKKIKKSRDEVAHQSLLLTIEETKDKEQIHEKTSNMDELNEFAMAVLMRLLEHWKDLDKTLNKLMAEPGSSGNG